MAYSDKVIDHYENPRNVGAFDKGDDTVGTGMVGAPACGDVMKLQIKVNPATGLIEDARFKTYGCGSAIASSSLVTEWVKGKSLEQARTLFQVCTDLMQTLQDMPQPVLARVHALATAAGCQLVASCDLAVAAQSAGFALPGGKGGLFCHTPLVAVARNIGRKRALEMAFTGDVIPASTAEQWGLIWKCVDDDQLTAVDGDLLGLAHYKPPGTTRAATTG